MHHRLISSYQGSVGLLTASEYIWGTFHIDYTAVRKRKLQTDVYVLSLDPLATPQQTAQMCDRLLFHQCENRLLHI